MKLGQVLSAFAVAARAVPLESRSTDYPGLYFSNGEFEITMFNDLHLGDAGIQDGIQKGTWSDDLTMDVVNKVLNYESTNLAVLNGDITTCEWLAEKDSYGFLNKAMSPFLSRKLPFAATFGNHDWSATCNTRWMSEHIWRTANDPRNGGQLTFTTSSVTGEPNMVGTTNYFIPLYSKVNGKQSLKMILWFFDSKGGFGYTGNGDNKQEVYGYVHPDTPKPVPADWPAAAHGAGLNVCFGRHTGYGGYSEVMRGGRHIVIYENALEGDNAIETWNRLENGEISGRVILNSTYGKDEYARVEVKLSHGATPHGDVAGRADGDGAKTTIKSSHSSQSRKSSMVTKATSSKNTKVMKTKNIDTTTTSTTMESTMTAPSVKLSLKPPGTAERRRAYSFRSKADQN
ncbi:hypothetical protein SLS60_000861 [Paraconiothyrium brasiliense]|uniref:Calcineurin-like phosphoesterase domain-containing protein n=1 Tax=Paraconiothyrium brasiliense TaxID=300254 RepID=A0ABR3S7G4_9PLEO